MELPSTFEAFIAYILSPTGLAALASLVLQFFKGKFPKFALIMNDFGVWITLGVCILFAGAGYIISIYDVIPIVENYWWLILLVFGASQGIYSTKKGVDRVRIKLAD